jgi:hypothetical protein
MTIPLLHCIIRTSSMIVRCTYKDDTNVRYPLFSFFGSQYSGCGDGRESKTVWLTRRSDNLAEIKFGMRAAAPSSIASLEQVHHPFFFSLLSLLLTQFKYHYGPLFYRVRSSNICRLLPLIDSSDDRKPISLISHSDVRYRGILAGIDPAASTIQLSNGMEYGTPSIHRTILIFGSPSVFYGNRNASVSF